MRIIGIHGKAGAGKDTVADYLVGAYGYTKLAFADPIRGMLTVLGVDPKTREEKEAPDPVYGVSFRYMAQMLGTEWGRNLIAEDFWIWVAEQTMKKCPDTSWVIPDVRMQNEADFIYQNGGTIIHLFRPGLTPVREHSSEAGIWIDGGRDYVIDNDGSISHLYHSVEVVMGMIKNVGAV